MTELISPFDETTRPPSPPAPRLDTLAGKRVTLLSIGKPKTMEFLNEIERLLEGRGILIRRAAKPSFARPAPREVIDEVAAASDAVIEALAD
jgi:hypothetical protein